VVEDGRVLPGQVFGDLIDSETAEAFLLFRPRRPGNPAEEEGGESEGDCDADHRSSVRGAEYNPLRFPGQGRNGRGAGVFHQRSRSILTCGMPASPKTSP